MSTPEKFTKDLTPAAIETVKKFGWPFFKAGALIVDDWPVSSDDFERGLAPTYLLVREAKIKEHQSDGSIKWVKSDQGKWNLPCGRLQPDESFADAALRESLEETGYEIELGDLCHIGHRADSSNPYVIFIYSAVCQRFAHKPNPEEIAKTAWFNYSQIVKLRNSGRLRNPDLTLSTIEQYRLYTRRPRILPTTYLSEDSKT